MHTNTYAHIHAHSCIPSSQTKAILRKTRCALAKQAWFNNGSIHKSMIETIKSFKGSMVQLNLNFIHMCKYTRVLACLTRAKLKKLAYVHTVACNFGVRMWNSEYMGHTRDVHHKLALGLPHYTCGVTTGTVAMKCNCFAPDWLLICCSEHCLKILLKRCGHTEYARISSCG